MGKIGLNQAELARELGVTQPTVCGWKKDGMPALADGSYDAAVVADWRAKRYREPVGGVGKGRRKDGSGAKKSVAGKVGRPRVQPKTVWEPGSLEEGLAIAEANSGDPTHVPGWDDPHVRKEWELAVKYFLDREERRGNLIAKDEAYRVMQKLVTEAKARLETLPEMIAMLFTSEGIRRILEGRDEGGDLRQVLKEQVAETVRDVLRSLQRGG